MASNKMNATNGKNLADVMKNYSQTDNVTVNELLLDYGIGKRLTLVDETHLRNAVRSSETGTRRSKSVNCGSKERDTMQVPHTLCKPYHPTMEILKDISRRDYLHQCVKLMNDKYDHYAKLNNRMETPEFIIAKSNKRKQQKLNVRDELMSYLDQSNKEEKCSDIYYTGKGGELKEVRPSISSPIVSQQILCDELHPFDKYEGKEHFHSKNFLRCYPYEREKQYAAYSFFQKH